YFEDGRDSAERFAGVVRAHLPERPFTQVRVLEFASGYGCVSRHLSGGCDLTCCDIHPAAHDFVSGALGLESVLSSSVPESLQLPGRYDVVFALSFFSHMPITTWQRWLARLADAVEPGGLLVFTTQGEASRAHFGDPDIPESGFWF